MLDVAAPPMTTPHETPPTAAVMLDVAAPPMTTPHEAQTPKAEAGAEETAPVLTVASFVITVGAFLFTRFPSLYNMSTA